MNHFYNQLKKFFIALVLCMPFAMSAQSVNTSVNGQDLVNAILGNGVTASNVTLNAANNSYGTFSGGNATNLGLDQGILLTTGHVNNAFGPNTTGDATDENGYAGDSDLNNLVGNNTMDATVLEFDFVANQNLISVEYVFGSEEYLEWVGSGYNDVFAFFVTGQNPNGPNYNKTNLAVVPGTNTPISINTVNATSHSAFFRYNAGGTTIKYDGFTVVLTAQVEVIPGQTYHFKFAIADRADEKYDSGVFIKAQSFVSTQCSAGTIAFNEAYPNPTCNNEAIFSVASHSSIGDNYAYFVTNAAGDIVAVSSNGQFNLNGKAAGVYHIHGVAYKGTIEGLEVGEHISDLSVSGDDSCMSVSSSMSLTLESCVSFELINCASEIRLECSADLNDFDVTGLPALEITGGSPTEVTYTYVDTEISNNGCVKIISRTWIITLGSTTETCVQIITLVDTEGPVITGVQEEINIQCVEELPAPDAATATDACGSASPVTSFTSQTGELVSSCCLTTANGPGADWSIWLPVLSQGCCFNSASWVFVDCGRLDTYADGTAHIHGTVANSANPAMKFIVSIWLKSKADYATWAGLGRGYRDDLGFGQPNKFIDWSYYELVDGFSTLTGAGDLEGDILFLSHAPASKYFGWQAGEGANNRNGNNGLSGSFSYTGTLGNEQVCCQNGDFNVDMSNCEEFPKLTCANSTSYTRFYRSIDNCYNATIVEQTINVEDTTAPIFDNCPSDITISCEEEIPAIAEGITATDNCVGDVTVVFLGEEVAGNDCHRTITRTWSATDICGNRADCIQVITIVDETAPVLNGLPEAEITVECSEVPEAPVVTATDNCTAEVAVSYNEEVIEGNCPGNYTIVRTWSASDNCQNNVEFVQTINVVDTEGPVFDAYPVYTHVECDELPGDLTATDNCGDVQVTLTYQCYLAGGCLGMYYRIYEAVDACGNVTVAEQYIAIMDTTAPEFQNVPADETLECSEVSLGEDGTYFGEGDVYAIDNCGYHFYLECLLPIDYTYNEEVVASDVCPQTFDVIRTWTATDYCGNTATASQIVHVVDTTAPYLTIPADYTANCEDELVYEDASAEDNCGNATINVTVETIPGNCPNNYTITRTFVAVDECGNYTEAQVQTITVVDVTAPVFGEENSFEFTYECDEEVELVQPIASDNCSELIEYAYADTNAWTYACNSGFTRIWTATDECGNSSEFYQYIYIQDTTAPVVAPYAFEISMPCDNISQEVLISATDNCNEVIITFSDEHVSGSCAGKIIRTYYVQDICGNVTEGPIQQFINLIDTVAPVVAEAPVDVVVECGDELPVYTPVWSDNCSEELTESAISSIAMDGCNQIISQVWFAADACGNEASVSRTITIVDTTNPYFTSFPENMTISCEEEVPAVVYPTAADNCDTDVEVVVAEVVEEGNCANERTIYRTFRGIDDCGNQVVETQVITIIDQTAPVFGEQNTFEFTYECDEDVAVVQPVATDNCSELIEYAYADTNSWTYACNSGFTRIWTATDECGNSSEFYQYIYIQDTTAPVITGAMDITRPCDDYAGIYVTATDNCNDFTISIVGEENVSGSCAGVVIRHYVATDICGNASEEFIQIIHLTDEVAPVVVSSTEDFTVECGDEYSVEAPVFADNCDENLTIVASSSSSINECVVTEVYVWTATDVCGNSTSDTTIVTIVDTTNPYFTSFPENMTISCEEEVPAVVYPTAADNCDTDVEVLVAEVVEEGNCANERTIYRTFRGIDDCGNQAVETQVITIVDETAPAFSEENSSEFVYECNEDVAVVQPVATDNCSELIEYAYADTNSWTYACNSGFTRIWTATDECGNSSEFYQYIYIQDTTAPVVAPYAFEISMPCDNISQEVLISATDNCNEVIITFSDEHVSGSCAGKIIRTYYVQDICGNVTEGPIQQFINLIDTVAPVVAESPVDVVVECGDELPVYTPVWSDNCSEELTESAISGIAMDGCNQIISQVWFATDACGNEASVSRTITIVDTTAPYFTQTPADIALSCTDSIPAAGAVAADTCDEEVDVTHEDEIVAGNCPANYTIVRTYTATDDCGNTAEYVQNIVISDNQAPVFGENNVVEFTYECNETAELVQPVATDNCSAIEYSYSDTANWSYGCSFGFTRIWTATDACGNASQFAQYINFHDTTAPVVEPYAFEIQMPCDNISQEVLISATDNCNEVIITFSDEYVSGSCAGKLIRTYYVQDICGNVTEGIYQQFINLIDTTAPVVEVAPENVIVECGEELPVYTPVWSDNCSEELTESAISGIAMDGCNQIISQVWYATDACGNEASVSRTITIVDTTAPYFTQVPNHVALSCTDSIPAAGAYAADTCDETVEISYNDEIVAGDCPANYTIVRTYTATDDCGNTAEYVQNIVISDNVAPVFGEQNDSFTYECGDEAAVVTPVATDNCSTITYAYADGQMWVDGCVSGFARTWTATDACGNVSAEFVQYITFEDTTEPVLTDCPSDLVLACDAEIPAPAEVTAWDACDANVEVIYEEMMFGDLPAEGSIADCDLITPARPANNPCVYPYDWAMALFNMPAEHKYYSVSEGNLVQYPDGSIHITATMNNVINPANGWLVDVWFQGGFDWAAWSSQAFPTGFKADCGSVGANHTEWLYYVLQAGPGAELTGFGGYAGSQLNLTHAPANNYFGFQLGDGANNYNAADNGFGGWFNYSGSFNGTSVNGAGDFAFELDCCPDYWIVRQWTATDCSGNTVTCSQTITFDSSIVSEGGSAGMVTIDAPAANETIATVSVAPNPASDNTVFTFTTKYTGKTSLEVYDIAGAKVADVYMGSVEAGVEYKVSYNVNTLATGVYMYRLTNGEGQEIGRLIINK